MGSITEVVQTLRHPKSHVTPESHGTMTKIDHTGRAELLDNKGTPGRQTPNLDTRSKSHRSDFPSDTSQKSRKSGRFSLIG